MNSDLKLQAEGIGLLFLFLLFLHRGFRDLFLGNLSSLPPTKASRNSAIDLVRGIAMCGIVLIHVHSYIQYYHPKDPILWFSGSIANLSRFSVPVFILTSGIFLSWKGRSVFWKSRFWQLGIPYGIFGSLGFFIKFPLTENWILDFFQKFLLGTIYEPYYYIPLLLQFYILYAIFWRNSGVWGKPLKWILFISSLFLNFLSNHFFPTTGYWQFIEPLIFSNFIFFFLFGILAKPILSHSALFYSQFLGNKLFLLVICTTLFYIAYTLYLTLQTGTGFSNHLIFFPIASFLLLFSFCIQLESSPSHLSKGLVSIFSYIGKNSLFVFLAHPILIHLFHAFDPYTFGGKASSYGVILILNLLIPLGIGELYQLVQKKIFSKGS
jgi:probable poly-beta-1,6-N-acetyl-D-glucosamine export protein